MDKKAKRTLAIISVPSFLIGADFVGAILLVTPIEKEFSVDITTSQWMVNAYALAIAMGLVAGGRLADMLGHRKFILIGLGIFFFSSMICAFAPNVTTLIFARAGQGIGSAFSWPCILALAATSVGKDERAKVMGILFGIAAVGNVFSPIIAGIAVELGSWRGFFVFNVFLSGLATLLAASFIETEKKHATDEVVDFTGMLVLSGAVFSLLFGLDIGADYGWFHWIPLSLFATSLLLFFAFPFVEVTVVDPMIPLNLMRDFQFSRTLILNGLQSVVTYVCLLYLPQYMQKELGWSVFWSALGLLPLSIVFAITNFTVGNYYDSIGPRILMAFGYLNFFAGCILILMLQASWGYGGLVPIMIFVGFGAGLVFGPAGTAAINALGEKRAGLAAGLASMFRFGIGAVGVAFTTAVMFVSAKTPIRDALTKVGIRLSDHDLQTLAAGTPNDPVTIAILNKLNNKQADIATNAVHDGFTYGLHAGIWIGLITAVAGFGISLSLNDSKLRSAPPRSVKSRFSGHQQIQISPASRERQ